uniref:Uncharacterized protein n=1 Tax=Tanacetum cinerariifolium TaxID=118510 RepID=A0A699GGZ2_TANCI|nr:hypothetical protein [Tanacetum cinerariifolium]
MRGAVTWTASVRTVSPQRRTAAQAGIRFARTATSSEVNLERTAPGARLVQDTGQVVEVDRAQHHLAVGDVASERGHFVFAVGPFVGRAHAAFGQLLGLVLGCFVQEEVVAGAVRPVGHGIELAVADFRAVLEREVHLVFRRARQRVAVDGRRAGKRAGRVGRRAAAGGVVAHVAAVFDEQVLVLDLGVVVAVAEGHAEFVAEVGLEVQLHALARDLVRIDQLIHVDRAVTGRQLLVLHAVLEDRGAQARAAIEQVLLDARLVRQRLFRFRKRREAGQVVQAALHRRRAVAGGHAGEQVGGFIEFVGAAGVPADVVRTAVDRVVGAADDALGLDARGREFLLVAGGAHAAAHLELVGHGVVERAERRIRLGVLELHRVVRVLGITRREGVEADAVDLDALVEVEQAGDPLQRAAVVRLGAELLRELAVVRQHVGRLHGKRDEAGAIRRRVHGAVAAIDVGAAVELEFFVTGDRVQRDVARVVLQADAAALGLQILLVDAVAGVRTVIEAVDDVVAALLDDIGAEQRGVAVVVTRMDIEQGRKILVRLDQRLQAERLVAVAFEVLGALVAGGIGVVHAVAAVLAGAREAQGHGVADGRIEHAFGSAGRIAAHAELHIAFLLEDRLSRVELDHAGRRVTAEQGALRAAQHFHLVHVEHREALEHGVFHHDVVHHQADRLRGVQVEVGVAEATDVKAREGAAVVRFDADRRRTAGQEADVGGAGGQHIELVALDGGDRHRHVADVFGAALGRDDHGFQLVARRGGAGGVGRGGVLRLDCRLGDGFGFGSYGRLQREGAGDGQGDQRRYCGADCDTTTHFAHGYYSRILFIWLCGIE